MSTRANIIIKDEYEELIFYRHCDGYPEGALPSLKKLLEWVEEGRARECLSQAAGWLIILGALESPDGLRKEPTGGAYGWQVGEIEPTTCIHGDIEYLYVIDLEKRELWVDGMDGYTYSGKFRE